MAKSSSERIADYRTRRKAEGVVPVTVMVPAADAELFKQFAAERVERYRDVRTRQGLGAPQQPWLAMLQSLAMPAAPDGGGRAAGAPQTAVNRVEAVLGEIVKRIIRLGWPVGMPLGSEPELMRSHGVSRTILRQAIRLLEHHSIARMTRGAHGGLVVAQPDLRATARAAAVYLEFAGIAPRDILTTRRVLELATLDLVIERLDDEGVRKLHEQVAAEASLDGDADAGEFLRFHFLLGELCGDPALRLFSGVVLQLADAHSTFHGCARAERDDVAARIKRCHKGIAEAIVARNGEKARMQLARYVAGIKDWLE